MGQGTTVKLIFSQSIINLLDIWGIWGSTCYNELGFKRKLFLFIQENPSYILDMRFNINFKNLSEDEAYEYYYEGNWDLTATRARFQYIRLVSYTH